MGLKLTFFCVLMTFGHFLLGQSQKIHLHTLDGVIAQHFDAIMSRNLQQLEETVNEEKVTLILPSGTYTDSFEDYRAINKHWFADKSWEIEVELVDKQMLENIGIVLTKISYCEASNGKRHHEFQYYLTLIFHCENQKWKLIFDQNTRIE